MAYRNEGKAHRRLKRWGVGRLLSEHVRVGCLGGNGVGREEPVTSPGERIRPGVPPGLTAARTSQPRRGQAAVRPPPRFWTDGDGDLPQKSS